MALPYLLGLAAGSIAVVSWKHHKSKQPLLINTDLAQESTSEKETEATPTSTKTSNSKKGA